jgi:predicted secreted protein
MMKWTSGLAIYFLFWSLSVFLVLPFGVRTADEAGVEKVPGQAESAPHEFRPGRVALRVTVVATILWLVFQANYIEGWITPQTFAFAENWSAGAN